DERCDRDGLRLRDLRDALDRDDEAVRRRPRRRRPDRRDDRAGRPAPRGDDAARGLELVPPALAGVAAEARARALDGGRARAGARAREARSLSSTTSGVGSRTRPPAGPMRGWRVGPGSCQAPHGVAGPAVYDPGDAGVAQLVRAPLL